MFGQTTESRVIRFKSTPPKNEFLKTLQKRCRSYFKDNNISPYADGGMWFKIILSAVAWISTYAFIMSDIMSTLPTLAYWFCLIAAFTFLGFINIFMAFNIGHDAAHNAISPKQWVNEIMGWAFNFVGGNIYLLKKIHGTHHNFSNIHGIDPQMESHGLLRNTPYEKYKPIHRFQHIYIHLIYGVAMLHWVTIKDFKWMFAEKHIGNEKNIKHPAKEIFLLLIFKALYYTLNIVLPFMLLSAPWWVILMGVLSITLLPGYTFALIFQANHVFEGTTYPIPDEEGNIENNYAIHTLETTMDFARNNSIACWLMGSINVHVIHHMFPQHCHVHSTKLTEILIETCKEFGVKYKELPTFKDAAQYHFAMIKKLSNPDTVVSTYEQENVVALQRLNVIGK